MAKQDPRLSDFGYKQELRRDLTLKDLIIYGLIFMVPIAPFGIYGSVVSSSNGMIALTYLIGMIAMFFTALSYGQLAKAFPIAGSVYNYAQRGINKPVGFLAGWMIILDYIFVPALLYVISSNSLTALIPDVPAWVWLIVFLLINTLINVRGIEMTAKTNIIFLIGELVVLAFFIAFALWGLFHGIGNGFTIKPFYNPTEFNLSYVFTAVSVAVLSFLGFDGISTLAEETRGGSGNIGKAMLWALGIVGILFILQTYLAALIVPDYHSFKDLDTAFYDVAYKVGGSFLSYITIIATILGWGIANALAAQAAISRILFSMSRDNNLPKLLSKVHPKFKTPYISTYLVGIISLIVGLIFMDNVGVLSSIVNCGALTAFLVIHIAVVNYYMVKNKSHNYWKHLIAPIIGFLIIGYVIINLDILAKQIGLIWILLGIIYYVFLYFSHRNVKLNV